MIEDRKINLTVVPQIVTSITNRKDINNKNNNSNNNKSYGFILALISPS